jgi:hypothetical protein
VKRVCVGAVEGGAGELQCRSTAHLGVRPLKMEIYVELLGEGVEAYRPVQATQLPDGTCRIESPHNDPDEIWRFPSGSVVRCRPTRFANDKTGLLAVELVGGAET